MSFENCKQIEINKIVYNVIAISDGLVSMHQVGDCGFYTVAIGFLKEIGARPVYEIPKKGDPVWSVYDNKSFPYISAGKMEGEFLVVYAPKDTVSGEISYGKIKNWKPFNPEELE
jgi:hypothetical protein